MDSKYFIDFDGTLISNKQRLYKFFHDYLPEDLKNIFNIDEFWTLKRCKINEIDWINSCCNTKLSSVEFSQKKKEKIEENEYLQYDELFPFTLKALNYLKTKGSLHLITRRSNKTNALNEITHFGLDSYFDDIKVIPHGTMTKAEVIRKEYNITKNDFFIGDTEDDISTGINLGIKTIFVLSGIRGKWLYYNYSSNPLLSYVDSINQVQ